MTPASTTRLLFGVVEVVIAIAAAAGGKISEENEQQ